MSETSSPLDRLPPDVETEEFQALLLTTGHWIALAPVPLFRSDLNTPHPNDLQTLSKLQQPLHIESPQPIAPARAVESEGFWARLCSRSFSADMIERANALLAWYLAKHLPRPRREMYLNVLDTIAARFLKSLRVPVPNALPSYGVRQRLERYLPHPTFTHYPVEPRLSPPEPREVAELFGADLWKQMLVSPIAAALAETQVRAGAVFAVTEILAHVTLPNPYNKPYPLEPHLVSGSWRRLFEGIFNPERKAETDLLIRKGLEIAARGLASLSFVERESLLNTIHEQIERGIDRADLKKITADESIGLMRIKVEDHLRQAPPLSESLPRPIRAISSLPTTTSPRGSTTRQTIVLENSPTLTSPTNARPTTVPSNGPTNSRPPVTPLMPLPTPKPVVTVERAEPFKMVSWEEAQARAGKVPFDEIRAWMQTTKTPTLLFDDQRNECSEVAIVRNAKDVPPLLWIIGDIHADLLTLANILEHAERVVAAGGEPPAFVFLGDFVDRGLRDHDTLLLLLQLIHRNPNRVCVIPGNHDIDLQWDDKNNRFRVSIEPAEYCEQLNSIIRSNDTTRQDQVEMAKSLIAFWQSRPKALILPDGTLLAHGGFPHADMLGSLQTPADLARPNCLSDFLWARIAETARKRPNRGNRGHEFGWETFAQFCKISGQIGLPPIKRFIRGHDHVPRRFQSYPDYDEYPVLTLNAMGRRMDGETDTNEGPHPFPVVARYVANQLPVVIQLPLDPNEVDRAFGIETSREETARIKKTDSQQSAAGSEKTGTQAGTPLLPSSEKLDDIARGVPLDGGSRADG